MIGWDSDFSYGYFKRLLEVIKSNFDLCLLSDAPKIVKNMNTHKCILRHDIDVSPNKAIEMAKIENGMGIKSTYLIMVNSPLYSIGDKIIRDSIIKLINLGHEIGLHFDACNIEDKESADIIYLEKDIMEAVKKLEAIIRTPVLSISFHRPTESVLRGPLMVCGLVNAYAKELMNWYLSDSGGIWRFGDPIVNILSKKSLLLSTLIHPIWWGDTHKRGPERLQEFFESKTKNKSEELSKYLDNNIFKTVGLKRSGLK